MSFFIDKLLALAENSDTGRSELKFVIPKQQMSRLRAWMSASPLHFHRPYPDRKIISRYLDTWDYRSYSDNIEGVPQRVKFRIRYYDEAPKQAYLEAKLRYSRITYKIRHAIDDESLVKQIVRGAPHEARGEDGWIRKLARLPAMDKSLAINLPMLYPSVETSYHREYYESADHPVRLTIDRDVKYRRAGHPDGHFTNDPLIICEVKTLIDADPRMANLIASLPFRMSRNSKYCRAVSSVCQPLVPKKSWELYY